MRECSFVRLAAGVAAFGFTVCLTASAEDWYWNYTKSGSSYANWSFPENWTNALGQAGVPTTGDAVYFINYKSDYDNKKVPSPDLGAKPLDYVYFSCPQTVNLQQGALYLQAGGRGLKIESNNVNGMSHWGSETLSGEGEVPYDIASGKSFSVQKVMHGATATLVLKGGGSLNMGPDAMEYGANTLGSVRIENGSLGYRIPWGAVSSSFSLSFGGSASTARFCLAKNNRLVRNFDYSEDMTVGNHGITGADIGGTLPTVNVYLKCVGTPRRDSLRFTGRFTGKAGLYWAPETKTAAGGNYEFVFAKGVSDTTSDLIVSNGTIRLTENALLGMLSSVVLEQGSVYQLDASARRGNHTGRLCFKDPTAKVLLGSGAVLGATTVEPFDGRTIAVGLHTAASDPDWIEGEGAVFVTGHPEKEGTYAWTGEATSPAFALAGNWRNETVPSTVLGSAEVKFAEGGLSAALSDITFLYGLLFAGPAFRVDAASEAAVLFLASGGIMTSGNGERYTLDVPMAVTSQQTWTVAANDSLVVSNVVSGYSTEPILKTGAGELHLCGQNDFPNVLAVTNGPLHVWSDKAFGDSLSPTWLSSKNVMTTFHGVTTDEPFEFFDYRTSTSIQAAPGTTNVFNGFFNASKGNLHVDAGSGAIIFRGGMSCQGNFCPYGTVIVERTAFALKDRVYPNSTSDIHLRVAQNGFGGNNFMLVSNGSKLWTEVPDAFASTRLSLRNNAEFHLCGNDQTLSVVNGWHAESEREGICESDRPAVLHLADVTPHAYENGPTSRICRVVFKGQVSLSKEGNQTYYIASESSTTGSLAVAKGRLVMLKPSSENLEPTIRLNSQWTGRWPQATAAIASGTGVLEIRHSAAFGRKTDIRAEGGTIQLNDGVDLRVADFYLGDQVQMPFKTYGGPDSAAEVKPVYPGTGTFVFSGTGVIRPQTHNPGMVILIR